MLTPPEICDHRGAHDHTPCGAEYPCTGTASRDTNLPMAVPQNLFLYRNRIDKSALTIVHKLRGLLNLGLNGTALDRLPSRFTGDDRMYRLPRGKRERERAKSPVKRTRNRDGTLIATAAATGTTTTATTTSTATVTVNTAAATTGPPSLLSPTTTAMMNAALPDAAARIEDTETQVRSHIVVVVVVSSRRSGRRRRSSSSGSRSRQSSSCRRRHRRRRRRRTCRRCRCRCHRVIVIVTCLAICFRSGGSCPQESGGMPATPTPRW